MIKDSKDATKFNIKGLGIDRLKTIYYVGLTESMTKAGDLMGLCQSAVSRQIQTLEDDLGFIMFKRKDRKVEITKEGKIMMNLADEVLHKMDSTLKSIKEGYEGLSGVLHVLTFPSFVSVMIPRYLRGFSKLYPEINLQVSGTYEEMFIADTDVIIRSAILDNSNLEQLPLYAEKIGLYASRGYLAEHGTPKNPQDLDNHILLALKPELERHYNNLNWVLKVGTSGQMYYRNPYLYLNSNDALANAVASGIGISTLATHHVNILNNPDIVRVLPEYTLENDAICFIFNKNVSQNSKYIALYEYLKKQIEEDKDIFEYK